MVVASSIGEAVESLVRWNEPPDPDLTYFSDAMHFPYPVSTLFQTTVGPAFAAGFTAATRELRSPVRAVKVCFRNGFFFAAREFAKPADEAEAREQAEAAEATMRAEVGRLDERWRDEHLPRVREHLARLATMDVEGASRTELAAMLDEVVEILHDLWTIHFRTVQPMSLGMQLFGEFYADLFGGSEEDAHALVVGLQSASIKAGMGLSDLAAAARAEGLDRLILETPDENLMAEFAQTEAGRAFTERLERYLETYGLRQDLFDFLTPTWREDPTIALANVRSYLRAGYDARTTHDLVVRAAAEATATARERLTDYPEAVRGQFEALLHLARTAHFLQEEHNFYIDQQGVALTRVLFLRVGERLVAAGAIDAPEDVFALTCDEVKAALASPIDPAGAAALRETVRTRQAALERARSLIPPPFIGRPPEESPAADNPMVRADARFWGAPPPPATTPNELRGNAGSRGTASGRARVARTLEEAKRLQQGEVLVAITTMPPWTPLFAIAAAVVTETGGPLSHCAIVAREYGIPAVVGTRGATSAIQTGQMVTVDGERGVVVLGDAVAG